MVKILDQNYVSWKDVDEFENIKYSSDGRIKGGNKKGGNKIDNKFLNKRVLRIMVGESSFQRYGSSDNYLPYDVIYLGSQNTADLLIDFVGHLVHEATHAAHSLGAIAKPPAMLIKEIDAAIQEEIKTRKSEEKILKEIIKNIDKKAKGLGGKAKKEEEKIKKEFEERLTTVGSLDPEKVKRDVVPAFNLTYFEHFFFERQLRQAASRLTDSDKREMEDNAEKAAESNDPKYYIIESGYFRGLHAHEYEMIWFKRLIAQKEWKEFQNKFRKDDPSYDIEKEKLIQDHAIRFFGGHIMITLSK